MSGSPGGSGNSGLWVLLGVIALSIVGGGIYLAMKPPPARPNGAQNEGQAGQESSPAPLTSAECADLAAIRNLGIAYLEDGSRLKQAEAEFKKLVERAPRELLGARNLAVCTLLLVQNPPSNEPAPDASAARKVFQRLKELEPDSPAPYVLAARLETKLGNVAEAAREYQKAVERAPDDATIQFEIFTLAKSTVDPEYEAISAMAGPALEAMLKQDPTNAYVLKENALRLAEAKSDRYVAAVTTFREAIQPIVPLVLQQHRTNANDLLDQAVKAAQEGQWPLALARTRTTDHVIKSQEWVRSDLRRLDRHPLTYLLYEFGDQLCEAGPPEEAASADAPIRFQRAATDAQLPQLAGVVDVQVADLDLDQRPDVLALTRERVQLMARDKGTETWNAGTTADVRAPMAGLIVADLDRDVPKGRKPDQSRPIPAGAGSVPAAPEVVGRECHQADFEVVTFGPAGVQVFRNDLDPASGIRTLVEVQQSEEFTALRDVLTAIAADVDHDGDLDLVISGEKGFSIWANQGKLLFAEITDRSSLPKGELPATSIVAVDWDRDLDLDLIVASNGNAPAGWLENLRHGGFRWRSFEGDLAKLTRATSLSVIELDGNVSWDLVGVGEEGVLVVRTTTRIPGEVAPLDSLLAGETAGRRGIVEDFDNDAHPDLIAWDDSGVSAYRGALPNRFDPVAGVLEGGPENVTSLRAADFDGDGKLDLVIAGASDVVILRNVTENENHWLSIRAMGKDEDKQGDVNHLGIGSLLEVRAGPRYQAQVISGPVTHFGLGAVDAPEMLRAVWTNGVPQPVAKPKTDAVLCREHDPKGSCPYIYTWTGEAYEFCTDGCWGAPLGLQHAEGIYARPRAWEYLTIPGEKLNPRNGKYSLQFTEELWEATYLDHMTLIAIDHPAETEIYSNEKVGPSEISEFKIHTVREKRFPVAARDKHGNDVLPRVLREDRRFMKGFDSESRRGLVEEHFLELDLGKLENPRQVTLFLTGWMYPTSTSLNLGVSSGKNGPEIHPPALWAPDAEGTWRVVRPFMGFPGGKTKTIAVDLANAFLTNDYRLRIVTNMEFYWDQAFFTVDEEPVALKTVELPVAHADLHYRGFSQIVPMSEFGPDHYDYAHVHNEPKWPPMAGFFTRFGNVTDLLRSQDDLQVVIGAGDEITIEFNVPSDGPPPGWKRDFLLHNVGWDKDADLNVVYGQAVEPLPFHGMTGYPDGIEEGFPQSAGHEAYLRTWQTRTQAPARFWRHVRNGVSAFPPER